MCEAAQQTGMDIRAAATAVFPADSVFQYQPAITDCAHCMHYS